MERIYYKVVDKDCDLFKRVSAFLEMEDNLRKVQKEAVEAKVPSFTLYRGEKGFNRIVKYTGFVFNDPDNVDTKVWKVKNEGGKTMFAPNLRTKAGRAMAEFLKDFKRTTCFDLNECLLIDWVEFLGNIYNPNVFKFNDCVYIMIDTKFRETFEKNNTCFTEITYGEITDAINSYNTALRETEQ